MTVQDRRPATQARQHADFGSLLIREGRAGQATSAWVWPRHVENMGRFRCVTALMTDDDVRYRCRIITPQTRNEIANLLAISEGEVLFLIGRPTIETGLDEFGEPFHPLVGVLQLSSRVRRRRTTRRVAEEGM